MERWILSKWGFRNLLFTTRSTEKHECFCKCISICSLLTFRMLLSQKQFLKARANFLPECLPNTNHNMVTLYTPTTPYVFPKIKSSQSILGGKTFCAKFRKKQFNCNIVLELTSFISVTAGDKHLVLCWVKEMFNYRIYSRIYTCIYHHSTAVAQQL